MMGQTCSTMTETTMEANLRERLAEEEDVEDVVEADAVAEEADPAAVEMAPPDVETLIKTASPCLKQRTLI